MPLYLGEEKISQISIGRLANIVPLSITSNGTYTAPSGVDGYSPITVNVSGGGGGGSYPWFGANTVLDYTKTMTFNLSEDTSWDSWTASTTATSILAAPTTNDFSYSYDRSLYMIWVVCTAITNFVLKPTATKKLIPISNGRIDWFASSGKPNNYAEFKSLGTGTHISKTLTYEAQLYYYNSSGTKNVIASNYGVYHYGTPTISESLSGSTTTISVKRNAIYARCSSSYFATARKEDIDSANTNVVITFDVYKTPRENAFLSHNLDDMYTAMNAAPEA